MRYPRHPRRATGPRRSASAAAALVVLGIAAEPAFGDARVGLGPPFVVQVIAKAGIDGGHQIVVEPFRDGSRVGWRARQLSGGQPPFSSIDPDCDVNGLLNDVVCDGAQTGATITMGDSRDVVRVRQINVDVPRGGGGFAGPSCFEIPGNTSVVTTRVSLGPNDDEASYDVGGLVCTIGTFAAGHELLQRLDVSGGTGADVISGSPFDDLLKGDAQGDTLSGLGGRDVLEGGDNRDTLAGGADDDTLRGGPGDDTLRGGDGDDRFTQEDGADVVEGGGGADRMSYESTIVPVSVDLGDDLANDGLFVAGQVDERDLLRSIEVVVGGGSADTLRGGAAADELRGGGGGDTIDGRDGGDTLRGEDGPDTLLGGPGRDTIVPGFGADAIDGGPDQDTLSYLQSGLTPVVVDLGAQGGAAGGHTGDPEASIQGIEHVTGGLGGDTLSGNPGVSNVLDGGFGRDTLTAGGGDTLLGGRGDDLLRGGSGFLGGSDVLDGGEDDDRIEAAGGGVDTILCGPGVDTAVADSGDIFGRFGVDAACEVVEATPVDDGPPSRAVGRALRADRAGRVRVRVLCPAAAVVPCRGVLTVRGADRRARLLGSRRYLIAPGATATVTLRLRGRLPARVSVRTRERGATAGPLLRRSAVQMRLSGR